MFKYQFLINNISKLILKSNSGITILTIILLLFLVYSSLVIVVLVSKSKNNNSIFTLAQAKKKNLIISLSSSFHQSTTTTTPNTSSTSNTVRAFSSQQQQSQSLLPYEEKNQQGTTFNGLNNDKVVILTFGDGLEGQYLYAKPILDKYGFKANFFVTCNRVGTNSKMNWQEIVQLYNEGHVIGSKTMDYGTKAIQHKDLNHLSANDLEYEVGQSKQCLLDHGINTTFFAVPKNVASNNQTVINTIAKYYDLAINGHSSLMFLHCNGPNLDDNSPPQTNCKTYSDDGTLTPANRYSIGEWSMQYIEDRNSYTNSQMFEKFISELNRQQKFNKDGIINAIPIIGYHNINATIPDASYTTESSATSLNLFEAEMKYLHDNGFRVITFADLGYDENNNSLYIKKPTSIG
jgi:peptidoglycan/xylan/chitin deacetylase (PgdA/CDA1 family)